MGKRLTQKLQLIVLLLIILSMSAVQAQENSGRYVIEPDMGAILVDAQGTALTEPGMYGVMYALDGLPEGVRRYAAELSEGSAGYALLDENGQPLTEHKYMLLEYTGSGIMFMLGERVGVMDLQGNVLIEAQYTYMTDSGKGSFLALRTNPYDDSADMVYRVLTDGSETSSGIKAAMLGAFDEDGMCAAMGGDGLTYGYLNEQAQWAIAPRFDWAGEFENGQARANAAGGAGLISLGGEWLIEPKYDLISREGNSLLAAVSGDKIDLIDPKTLRTVRTFSGNGLYASGIGGGRAGVMQEDLLTVVGQSGETLFSTDKCTSFNLWSGMENELIVMLGGSGNDTAYLFGMDGELLAGAYQDIMPLGMNDEGMYYLAVTYEATQVEYENGMSFWDEIPGTRRCSVIAPNGEVLCTVEAEYISYCGEDRMLIYRESGWTFADLRGNAVAEFENPNVMTDAEDAVQAVAEMGE